MRYSIGNMFLASLRECVLVATLIVTISIQACATTEEERMRLDALHEERLYEIRIFIDACEDKGGDIWYSGPFSVNPTTNIPRDAMPKHYSCLDPSNVAEAGPIQLPPPDRPQEGRMTGKDP